MLKKYFANYVLYRSDVTFARVSQTVECHRNSAEPWRATIVDTGAEILTGGRLKRVKHLLMPGETFLMTYGDDVTDISVEGLLATYCKHGKLAVVKPPGDGGYSNDGFFALETTALDRIPGDATA